MAGEPEPVEALRMLIKKHGLTQAQAAERLGVTDRTMRRWLSRDARASSECPSHAPIALRCILEHAKQRRA